MAIGERIRWFRNKHSMTQKELGVKLGFKERSGTVRMGQYENSARAPKKEMIQEMARIFDVAPEALEVPEIDNYIGLMHTLFALEDMYGLTITKLDGEICLKQDINHRNYDRSLASGLVDWWNVKERLTRGSMLMTEYDHWRYNYPADLAEEIKKDLGEMRKQKTEEQ